MFLFSTHPDFCEASYAVALYSWYIANNFVIGRCLQILCQIAFSIVANYFRSYRKKQFGIKSVGFYSTLESGINVPP